MDFQCSDGHSMLVTGYVTKMKDHNILKGLMVFFACFKSFLFSS